MQGGKGPGREVALGSCPSPHGCPEPADPSEQGGHPDIALHALPMPKRLGGQGVGGMLRVLHCQLPVKVLAQAPVSLATASPWHAPEESRYPLWSGWRCPEDSILLFSSSFLEGPARAGHLGHPTAAGISRELQASAESSPGNPPHSTFHPRRGGWRLSCLLLGAASLPARMLCWQPESS